MTDTVIEMNVLPRLLASGFVYWKIEFDDTNVSIYSRLSYKSAWVLNHQAPHLNYFDVPDHQTNFIKAGPILFTTSTIQKYARFEFIKIYSDRE